MSFAAPVYLLVGALVGAAVIGIHFLARSRPARRLFPTMRFVPAVPASAAAMARRPSDWWLLALRLTAVLLIAVAFARPWGSSRQPVQRVVAVLGWRAADPAELAAVAREIRRADDLVLVVANPVSELVTGERVQPPHPSIGRTTASVAILAALEAARARRSDADSFTLTLVMPLVQDVWDAATPDIRAAWNGAIEIVSVAPRGEARVGLDVDVSGPVADGMTLVGSALDTPTVRVRSAHTSMEDSTWARESGGVLITWPADSLIAGADTARGLVADGVALLGPVLRTSAPRPGRSVVQWIDGASAATEQPLGAGCSRESGFVFPHDGDLVLRPAAQIVLHALVAPCGGWPDTRPLERSSIAALEGNGGAVVSAGLNTPPRGRIPADPWWLVLATAVLGVEWLVRRGRRS
ncbi:MAG TPA: BatA domain-containing protein [Gemmatimonadales bacterium]